MSISNSSKPKTPSIPSVDSQCVVLAAGVALFVVLLDVLTKWAITKELGPGSDRSSIEIAGSFFELHFAQNGGVAFGLLDGNSTFAGILVGLVIVPLSIVLLYLAGRGASWAIGSGFVLGGATGNLVDRIGDQTVTDFVSIGRWPSFNVADASITVGALLLIVLSYRTPRDEQPVHENDPR
ncbi:MAG: signal peptidase II [Thermomicrobiales bacterium]|nr:signal peptidase II [Thermomicrobiales bacterium]